MLCITDTQSLKDHIRRDVHGRYNLTDLWKVSGSESNRKPADWQRTEEAIAFVRAAGRILNMVSTHIIESKRGKGGSTWGHEQVFLEYAQYLDPRLAVLVNQAFLERLEEEANPELAIQRGQERAVRSWKKQGKSDQWIENRTVGVATRKAFTSALAGHGVKRQGYRNCTNAIYTPLYGGTSEVVRHKKGLAEGARIRDNMDDLELAAVNLAEKMAQRSIETNNLRGNAQCELACSKAARSVAKALLDDRQQTSPASLNRSTP